MAVGTRVLDLGACGPQVIYEFRHFMNAIFFFNYFHQLLPEMWHFFNYKCRSLKSQDP